MSAPCCCDGSLPPSRVFFVQDPALLAQKAAEEDRQIAADKHKIEQKMAQPKARRCRSLRPMPGRRASVAVGVGQRTDNISTEHPFQGILDPTHKQWKLEDILG